MPKFRREDGSLEACGNCRWYIHHPDDYLRQRNPEIREQGRTLLARQGYCMNSDEHQAVPARLGAGCHCDRFDWAVFDEFI